jgi:hypothetical protein
MYHARMASRFAYDRSGSVIATADGTELLVYAGDDERPLWKRTLEAPVDSVGTTVGEVLALAGGRLLRFEAMGGAPLGAVEVGASAGALAVARDGTAAVLLDDGVLWVAGGRAGTRIAATAPRALALSDDGAALALGLADGKLTLHDRSGAVQATTTLPGGVRSIAWNVLGGWVVAAGDGVLELDAKLRNPTSLLRAPEASLLAVSADGGLVACRTGERAVQVHTLPQPSRVARVEYLESPVDGVAFGPDVWLGVGLPRGDANKINLVTGACHRTDPHPGRARNAWQLQIDVDKERVKEGRSTANPSADAVRAKLQQRAQVVDQPRSKMVLWVAIAIAVAMVAAALIFAR